MNFEHLIQFIITNREAINNSKILKRRFWLLLQYWVTLLEWHKKKLRPGKVGFDFHYIFFDGILIYSYTDFRFIRQNTYESDQLKPDAILERQSWKNNFKDNLALSSVFLILFWELYKILYTQFQERLPSLAFRSEFCDFILKFGFNIALKPKALGSFEHWAHVHYWITDVLIDFCINLNIIF